MQRMTDDETVKDRYWMPDNNRAWTFEEINPERGLAEYQLEALRIALDSGSIQTLSGMLDLLRGRFATEDRPGVRLFVQACGEAKEVGMEIESREGIGYLLVLAHPNVVRLRSKGRIEEAWLSNAVRRRLSDAVRRTGPTDWDRARDAALASLSAVGT